jgi:hypothetical protein
MAVPCEQVEQFGEAAPQLDDVMIQISAGRATSLNSQLCDGPEFWW